MQLNLTNVIHCFQNESKSKPLSYTMNCKERFFKKQYTHLCKDNLKEFYELCDVNYSDKLFEVKFKKSFAFYLFLYLKSEVKDRHGETSFIISKPVDVNFSEISHYAGVSRNTVKWAYKELIELGLIIPAIPYEMPKHNTLKFCSVVNDSNLLLFDDVNRKAVYSI